MLFRRMFLGGLVSVALLWVVSEVLAHGSLHRGAPPLERQAIYRTAPRFALITQEGEQLTLRDLGGQGSLGQLCLHELSRCLPPRHS